MKEFKSDSKTGKEEYEPDSLETGSVKDLVEWNI